jgi:DNA topoisomerase-3
MDRRRLIITEKPSVARAIAQVIGGCAGGTSREYIDCGDTRLTWCYGHLLEMANPEEYDPALKPWREDRLPILPHPWRVRQKDDSCAQRIRAIREQIRWASTIVHAGDPDREGQRIVDEVLEFLDNRKPVERLWLASLDEGSIRKAMERVRSNTEYGPLSQAALARARADWLYGINLTRAMTCAARTHGTEGVISVGRVQTPTLALVVARDLEIERFKPVTYFVPVLDLITDHGERFRASWVGTEDAGEFARHFDPEGRLLNEQVAQGIVGDIGEGEDAHLVVREFQERRVVTPPPLPHSLSSLQKEASARYGASASKVLEAAQRLYEDRVQTYPRTDCRYLPEEQFGVGTDLLRRLANHGIPGAREADPARRGRAWNTAKVTAHHAIVPTGDSPPSGGLGREVFDLVARGYVRQFHPDQVHIARKASLDNQKPLAGSAIPLGYWAARGRGVLEPGWTSIGGEDSGREGREDSMPSLAKGERVRVMGARVERRHTSAPARFTDGTLIDAMASIHRWVKNPRIKARLKESSGIGTEATRAAILETLLRRGFLKRNAKALISTLLGREVIEVIPGVMSDPGITALWEDYLEQVAKGEAAGDAFCKQISDRLPKLLEHAKAARFQGKVYPCSVCGHALRKFKGKKSGKFFWACSSEFDHPRRADEGGEPGKVFGQDTNTRSGTIRPARGRRKRKFENG